MNGINSIRNGYTHLKALSTQANDISFNIKTDINSVLPSITNLNNVPADMSFNSYLNSDSIPISNNVSNSNLMINEYQNNTSLEYSLPTMRGFSQMTNQYYSNGTDFNHQSCNQNDIRYHYQDYNYHPIVSQRNWMESYPNDCLKPPVQSFQVSQNSYLLNGISHSNTTTRESKTVSKVNIKDEKYSVRRQKNNIAAKKCRDNKKLKNQEVCDLIMKYEKDNEDLKIQINSVKLKIEELVKQLR